MRMKLRIDEINSQHIHLSVFSDSSINNNGTFKHLGRLTMGIGEYQLFGVALAFGNDHMTRTLYPYARRSKIQRMGKKRRREIAWNLYG